MSGSESQKFRFSIDRGGTFTDVYADVPATEQNPNRSFRVLKLLSVDPNYPDAPREGIRRILEQVTGKVYPRDKPLDTSLIESIRMGTTVATNALLERKGENTVLLITKGFGDLLHIGNQTRPQIFDLSVAMPSVIYSRVIEVNERIALREHHNASNLPVSQDVGITGEKVWILEPLDVEKVKQDLIDARRNGFQSIAVALLHSYMWPKHEQQIEQIAKQIGFENITLSSTISPMVKIVPRGNSAVVDAYLTPKLQEYIRGFSSGFDEKFRTNVSVAFMQSDGGLAPVESFSGFKAILSGPAGGVVGYSVTAYKQQDLFDDDCKAGGHRIPVLGFDMGGTSTDVSRYAGQLEHVLETSIAGVTILTPQLDVNTVAAGGGSKLFYRQGRLDVGPESAGANPGPVCYRRGGPLTVTDANLFLGRIDPSFFPHIFGKTEDQPLDEEATQAAFERLSDEINKKTSEMPQSLDELAHGFIKVANEAMTRPMRSLTTGKGLDVRNHILATFGGAGGQHACAIAKLLGIKKVFIHRHASILSAYGLSMASVVHEVSEPRADIFNEESLSLLKERIEELSKNCEQELRTRVGYVGGGAGEDMAIELQVFLHMRYQGTDCAVMTPKPKEGWSFGEAFIAQHIREFGFHLPERNIVVDDIRVRGECHPAEAVRANLRSESSTIQTPEEQPQPVKELKTYFEGIGRVPTKVYRLGIDLKPLHKVQGPALLIDRNNTIVVELNCTAMITRAGDVFILIDTSDEKTSQIGPTVASDPIYLSIFGHRFMSIAEQMGRVLQNTAISTNIKERLDFSCALFDQYGGLVANAPHIPVHLGAMQETVRFQIEYYRKRNASNELDLDLEDGDVLMSNHPKAGGSHLPDITIITPVFDSDTKKIVFFVASRGHHADIGGITPGSMPPHSKELYQEGASVKSLKLVSKGVFQQQAVTDVLNEPGKFPGCSGTRNLRDNISDLKAQVAANHRGILLVRELIKEFGLEVVQAYMRHIQQNAEHAAREMLKKTAKQLSKNSDLKIVQLNAIDYMDDGSPIKLSVSIDQTDGSAVFDFAGTGHEVYGNTNSPPAVTYAATIYVIRCLVNETMPLNQGCLNPVTIKIPPNSLLCPSDEAAVVGGNVLTSQRLTDVIIKAFEACGASQGCMNNVTFGNDRFGYYETIGGGAGAGPSWHGRSGVHCHMSNTRITDAEILERRYPVLLRRFGLRQGSGGRGRFQGGEGIIREYEFLEPLVVSVLSERRTHQPFGMHGGLPGASGLNLLFRLDGRVINITGKNSINVNVGDRLQIHSPGGGGYGFPDAEQAKAVQREVIGA